MGNPIPGAPLNSVLDPHSPFFTNIYISLGFSVMLCYNKSM